MNQDCKHERLITCTKQVSVGERVRSLRLSRNISVRTLAARAGFSPSFISQLENGLVSPSIGSLERIVSFLGVTLASFFAEQPATTVVTRSNTRQELTSSWSQARIEVMVSADGIRQLEAVMITIAPGGRSGKLPSHHAGEEFVLVFEGQVSLTLGATSHVLHQGDSVSFRSEIPHLWENSGTDTARIVIVSSRFIH